MTHMVYAALAAACLISVSAAAEEPRRLALDARQIQALGIATEALAPAGGAATRTLPGRVVIPPSQMRVVAAPVAGLVERLEVAAQETVRPGQVLAVLASPMLLEAQRDYLQAATQARLAESVLRRDEQLFREGIIAEGRLQAAEAAHLQAQAALNERRQVLRLYGMDAAAIDRLARGLSGTLTLTAPFGGTVLELMATAGQRVEAATPLYRIARLSPLWLEMDASPAAAEGIVPGAEVRAGLARGRVLSVGRALHSGSQTVPVRAELSQGTEALRAGQFLEAQVAVAGGPREWRVPAGAVARQQGQAYLFVQEPKGFAMTPVRVVRESANQAIVTGALTGGERVAVKGVAALKAIATGAAEGE